MARATKWCFDELLLPNDFGARAASTASVTGRHADTGHIKAENLPNTPCRASALSRALLEVLPAGLDSAAWAQPDTLNRSQSSRVVFFSLTASLSFSRVATPELQARGGRSRPVVARSATFILYFMYSFVHFSFCARGFKANWWMCKSNSAYTPGEQQQQQQQVSYYKNKSEN